jgi:hypothetical protein
MKLAYVFLGMLCVAFTSGCAYKAVPMAAPAVNIVTNFDNKVPGKWALVFSEDISQARKEVKPSSFTCSAHTYPIDAGQAFESSLRKTMDAVFESTVEPASSLTIDAMKKGGYAGQVSVRLNEFAPRLSCQTGFWSGTCTSSVEIGFAIEVRNNDGKIVHNSSAGGSKSAEGDAGGACNGGSVVLSDATSRATKDALERVAERLSNAPALRMK